MRVLVGLSLLVVAVASNGQNFPDSDVNRWAYDTLDHLERCKLLTASLPIGRDGPIRTRYEFGVAAYTNISALSERLDEKFAAFKAGKRDLVSLPKDQLFDELVRLIGHFRKEIASLGTKLEDLSRKVANDRKRAAALRLLYVSEVSPRATKYFPDVPQNHWAFDAVESLGKFGLIPQKFMYSELRRGSPEIYSRAKWAEFLEETVEQLPLRANISLELPEEDVFIALDRIVRIFVPELKGLRLDVSELYATIDSVRATAQARRTPLAGVPSAHWASQAIKDLHAAGVLHGYPGGKFGG